MEELLIELGFSKQDILLVYMCPLFSTIGGITNWIMKYKGDFEALDLDGEPHSTSEFIQLFEWILGRILISAVLGLVLALYMVGALNQDPTSIARVLALSILLGFSAPVLWRSQEKHLLNTVDKKIKDAYSKIDLEKSSQHDKTS